MGRLRLRAPKLDWKGKTLKLRAIVLAGAPLTEIDPRAVAVFDAMRRALRGEMAEGESMPAFPVTDSPLFSWEPYADERGNEETIRGWHLTTTLYCVDAKPWWLVRASNKLDNPPEKSIAELYRVVDLLGAHIERDRIMNCSFGNGDGYSMWWTWINQHPLLEMQFRKEPMDMRIVPEGSPVPEGYMRFDRATASLSRKAARG